jgi:hypothetical protein
VIFDDINISLEYIALSVFVFLSKCTPSFNLKAAVTTRIFAGYLLSILGIICSLIVSLSIQKNAFLENLILKI